MATRHSITRREFLRRSQAGLAVAAAGTLAFPAGVRAAHESVDDRNELVIGVWGGLTAKLVKKYVIADLEAKYPNTKFFVKEGGDREREAQLRVNPQRPPFDILYLTNEQSAVLVKDGLADPVDPVKVPEYNDQYEAMKGHSGYPCIMLDIGLAYNPKRVEKPTSWWDLWNSKYKGHVIIGDFRSVFGPALIGGFARIMGGDERKPADVAKAQAKFEELGPSIVGFYAGSSQAITMFESGDAWIGPVISGYVWEAQKRGVSVDVVRPKEGVFAVLDFISIPVHSRHKSLALEFTRLQLAPKAQLGIAQEAYFAPTNKKVELNAELRSKLLHGDQGFKTLIVPDLLYARSQMPNWIDWFERKMKK